MSYFKCSPVFEVESDTREEAIIEIQILIRNYAQYIDMIDQDTEKENPNSEFV